MVEVDTIDKTAMQYIGQVEIKEGGLTLNCTFDTVKKLAKEEALKLGGNCLVITNHKKPDAWSTCHRISADIYKIDDPRRYESEVTWHKNRKLVIDDFKGQTEKRPFTAATASGFRSHIEGRPISPRKYTLELTTYFDCYSSYFKRTEFDSQVLAHEQIHFDISELYARKFIERVEERAMDLNEFLQAYPEIIDAIYREMQLKQDEYDAEVYPDPSKQAKWETWISEELEKYKSYSRKTLIVDMR